MDALEQLITLLGQYDSLPLDYDTLTRVLHTVLFNHHIAHQVFSGTLTYLPTQTVISAHLWIETVEFRIDYRARKRLNQVLDVPHGIVPLTHLLNVDHNGQPTNLPVLSDIMFKALKFGR